MRPFNKIADPETCSTEMDHGYVGFFFFFAYRRFFFFSRFKLKGQFRGLFKFGSPKVEVFPPLFNIKKAEYT